jgi:murein L,D-transpeptidase YafK
LRSNQVASLFSKALILAVAATGLANCSLSLDDIGTNAKTGTVRVSTLGLIDSLDMDRAAPILIRIYKEERTLEVWKQDRTGKFALLKPYPICTFSGKLGPKLTEGDRQAPEGFYDITPAQMNPMSREYLAFNIGFPNAFDRSLRRTGSVLMVHGGCKSIGCYAMTDYEMEEIYGLLNEAFQGGQGKIQLQAFPFRMTEQNLQHHAQDPNAPFWQMLKAGSDALLAAGQPPTVAVCDRHYVFNPAAMDRGFDPSAPCPPGVNEETLAGEIPAFHSDAPTALKTRARLREASLLGSRVAARPVGALCRFKRKVHDQCSATARLQAPTLGHHKKSSAGAKLVHRTTERRARG